MIKKHRQLVAPAWNATLWQYMSLEKFLTLLISKKLHFTNAMNFSDKNEGRIPEATLAYLEERWTEHMQRVEGPPITLIEHVSNVYADINRYWISCWSMNRHENYALWRIYLGGSKVGVAVRTNRKMLESALNSANNEDEPDAFMSKVSYSGRMHPGEISPLTVSSSKSPHYRFESEVRLLATPNPNKEEAFIVAETGRVDLSIDLGKLVKEIYVSPFAGSWFLDTFHDLLDKYAPGLRDRVKRSVVNET